MARIVVAEADFDIGAEIAALTAGRTDIGGIGCFVGTVLQNNQFGYSLIFVDSPKLDPAFRAKLMEECDEAVSP